MSLVRQTGEISEFVGGFWYVFQGEVFSSQGKQPFFDLREKNFLYIALKNAINTVFLPHLSHPLNLHKKGAKPEPPDWFKFAPSSAEDGT